MVLAFGRVFVGMNYLDRVVVKLSLSQLFQLVDGSGILNCCQISKGRTN